MYALYGGTRSVAMYLGLLIAGQTAFTLWIAAQPGNTGAVSISYFHAVLFLAHSPAALPFDIDADGFKGQRGFTLCLDTSVADAFPSSLHSIPKCSSVSSPKKIERQAATHTFKQHGH